LEQNELFSYLKTVLQEVILEKLTQFSQVNNELDAPASKKWFSIDRYMCFINSPE
jgi:hypothetical protein